MTYMMLNAMDFSTDIYLIGKNYVPHYFMAIAWNLECKFTIFRSHTHICIDLAVRLEYFNSIYIYVYIYIYIYIYVYNILTNYVQYCYFFSASRVCHDTVVSTRRDDDDGDTTDAR